MTVLLGLGVVAVSLIILIGVITLLHVIISAEENRRAKKHCDSFSATPLKSENEPDHGTLVAVVSAAVAEQLGTDATAIRILSIRKL